MIKQLATKIVYQNPWMKVREDTVEFANGHQGIYGVVEKDHFALIVPFDGTHLHLVKQFRYATGKYSLEFPQGKHEDGKTERPLELAQAELQEEIGARAGQISEIAFLYEAPGYSNQGFHLFFATDLTFGTTRRDLTEADLEHISMTIDEFEQAIVDGTITDAPTISAFTVVRLKKLL
jgi:8-oxo-dGTP pyrophosphatase MutT (NUDIX family)